MKKKAIFSTLAVLTALAAALLPARGYGDEAAPSTSEDELRQQLAGTWVADNSAAANQAVIDRAIARCTSNMNYLLRGTFSDQLRANTPPRPLDWWFRLTPSRVLVKPKISQSFSKVRVTSGW